MCMCVCERCNLINVYFSEVKLDTVFYVELSLCLSLSRLDGWMVRWFGWGELIKFKDLMVVCRVAN